MCHYSLPTEMIRFIHQVSVICRYCYIILKCWERSRETINEFLQLSPAQCSFNKQPWIQDWFERFIEQIIRDAGRCNVMIGWNVEVFTDGKEVSIYADRIVAKLKSDVGIAGGISQCTEWRRQGWGDYSVTAVNKSARWQETGAQDGERQVDKLANSRQVD